MNYQNRNICNYNTEDDSKIFYIDKLESGNIKDINFDTYDNHFGSASFHGLCLSRKDFELLKKAGGICGGNFRSENVRIAKSKLRLLKDNDTN